MKNIGPTNYDASCYQEFQQLYERVAGRFVNVAAECPYELPYVATFHQGAIIPLGERALELFLFAGYRRNGNWLYGMRCRNCASCLSIRLYTPSVTFNRNQLRAKKRNADLCVEAIPLVADAENVALCGKFLKARYPKDGNNAALYFRDFFLNGITTTMQVQYRLDGKLVGNAIVDIGQQWMNAVYFYFDPEEGRRSLGTWNIVYLVELCKSLGIDYLYLGYLIHEVSAMEYKKNFRPHQILVGEFWQTIS